MKDANTAVFFDLDSTLADNRHRRALMPTVDPASSWEIFSLACDGDSPIPETLALMSALWPLHQIHIVSGRSDVAVDKTARWLAQQSARYDFLRLRGKKGDGDGFTWARNSALKVNYIREVIDSGIRGVLMVEDVPEVAQQIRAERLLPVLNVATGIGPET